MKQFILGNFGKSMDAYDEAYYTTVLSNSHGVWMGDYANAIAYRDKLKSKKSTIKILLYHDIVCIAERMLYYPGVREAFYKKDASGNKVYNSAFNYYYADMNSDWRSYSTSYLAMRIVSLGLDGAFLDEPTGTSTFADVNSVAYIKELRDKLPGKLIIPNCVGVRTIEYAQYIDGWFEESNKLYQSTVKKYAECFIK